MEPQTKTPKCQILKSIQNCSLSIPTAESENRYFQISVQNGPTIRLYFINHSIIRVRVSFETNPQFTEGSYMLMMTGWDDCFDDVIKNRKKVKLLTNVNFQQVNSESQGSYYRFQTNQLIGKITKNPYCLSLFTKSNTQLYSDLPGRSFKTDLQSRIYHYQLYNPSCDYFYGFGQTGGQFQKSKSYIKLSPSDNLGYDAQKSTSLYKNIPFYIKVNKDSKNAVGIWYHNLYDCSFNMGVENSGYWDRYTCYQGDGGDIDYFIINGPSMKRVIQRYTDLTGKTAMAPIKALGYIGSTMYYSQLQQNCDQAIKNFIKKCKKQGIPISNFHLSSGYTLSSTKPPKRYTLTWNPNKFPSVQNFIKDARDMGVQISPNIKPGMLLSHPLYEEFAKANAFIKDPQDNDKKKPYVDRWWGGDGSFVDFTSKAARELWKKYLNERIIGYGIKSIWNDNNEYQSLDNRGALCQSETPQTPKPLQSVRPIHSLLMCKSAQQSLLSCSPKSRPYQISRSGCPGLQRYASSWSGDNYTCWKSLQYSISTMLNMGISGFAIYGCDVGGFWGPKPEEELLVRWVQNGIFMGRFSLHSCNCDNTVTEPWMYQGGKGRIGWAVRFRYAILPYLYSLMYFSHVKGRPIMRALVYQFQDTDLEACAKQGRVFMFGPYMLVANILQPMSQLPQKPSQKQIIDFTKNPQLSSLLPNCLQNFASPSTASYCPSPIEYAYKDVYLPKGTNWYPWNFQSQKITGGTTVSMKVSHNSIPIFIKDKCCIPLAYRFGKGDKIQEMNHMKVTGLFLKIVYEMDVGELSKKCKNLEFVLFQDDGQSVMVTQLSEPQQSDRTLQSRLNPPLSPTSSYTLTKISLKYPQLKKEPSTLSLSPLLYNEDMLIIDINKQGNIEKQEINTIEDIVLEIKSGNKMPAWVTIGGRLCFKAEYVETWQEYQQVWKLEEEDKVEELGEGKEVTIGCWYFDVTNNTTLIKFPQCYYKSQRNIQIRISKSSLIQFKKQYENEQQQSNLLQNNSSLVRTKDQVIVHQLEEIEQRIGESEIKKIKQRKRIIAKDSTGK